MPTAGSGSEADRERSEVAGGVLTASPVTGSACHPRDKQTRLAHGTVLGFLLAVSLPIRLLRVSELRLAAAHIERHALESGRGPDIVFAPFLEFDRDAYEDSRYDSWRRPTDAPGWERCWAYFDGERVVGHVDLTGPVLNSALHRARLGIGVERKYRGQGIGASLLEVVVGWARREPELAWIDLSVFAHNVGAQRLYSRFGFREVSRTQDAYRLNGQSIDDVHMVLQVA